MTDRIMLTPTPLLIAALALAACATGESGSDSLVAESAGGTTTTGDSAARAAAAATRCAPDNGGLVLPTGFCASIFADDVGGARHIDVAANGDVFVQLRTAKKSAESGSGRGGVLALRDTDGDGVADSTAYFGALGGTGVRLHDGWLYAEDVDHIMRYRLPAGTLVPAAAPETLVTGLPRRGHEARNFALDDDGALFVNVGSRSNSCQVKDRGDRSPGHDPCTELETRAGIWRFDAGRAGQTQETGKRYATGIRNATGLAVHPRTGDLWATQHGRDQLLQNWPQHFSAEESAENPAEELMQVDEGDDFGWPYCFWSTDRNARVLAPEYGGDGEQVGERCADRKAPAASFPGHWAPMDVLFYSGSQFPERYRDGALISFHGSWNRAPRPQAGYNVVFQPLDGESADGRYEVFADGFAGETKTPSGATHRPVGLAEGPDGALYVTDDKGGRIWKIVYRGR